ncbi:MAG: UV damage repair endonuclease UvsE [Desulfobacterales bacterium CG2_30_60_27]|nr:MAG: UV damage repair endonuclease UvsE [Desulfobacterales bacterium CG2_30_60_27]
MIRLGLCCIFREEPIRFRTITVQTLRKLPRVAQLDRVSEICLDNSKSLLAALTFAHKNSIGAFRILSPFMPRCTHPEVAYTLADLPDRLAITAHLAQANDFRTTHDIRLSFHPDQFIILSSPNPEVVVNSCRELEYQGLLAEQLGADTITIHGGGKYDSKSAALARFADNFGKISSLAQQRLALENDDRIYTVRDLLPVCRELNIPLVYDLHHHRCNPDGLSVAEATSLVIPTWEKVGREPYFHVSSPRHPWGSGPPRPHADYIDPTDFPECWKDLRATVDVEAKAKELAVFRLQDMLSDGNYPACADDCRLGRIKREDQGSHLKN